MRSLRELVETLGAYVNETRLPPGDERNLQRLESDADAVQVMTVHKAKGLEADVVFLYGGFNRRTPTSLRVFHDRQDRRVVHLGSLDPQEQQDYASEIADEDRRMLYVALTRARGRLYLPRCPTGSSGFPGPYRLLSPILDKLLADARTSRLFHRLPVACPAEAPVELPAPSPAALSAWQPPELPADLAATEFRQIAKQRAGFVVTSYTGVKRRHGGFVVAEDPADLSTANEPSEPDAPAPVDPHELARGRLSGIFLHAILDRFRLIVSLIPAHRPSGPPGLNREALAPPRPPPRTRSQSDRTRRAPGPHSAYHAFAPGRLPRAGSGPGAAVAARDGVSLSYSRKRSFPAPAHSSLSTRG